MIQNIIVLKFIRYMVVALVGLISYGVNAACYTNQGGATPITTTINATNIVVQRDATVGAIIGTINVPTTGSVFLSCDSNNSPYYYEMTLFTTASSIAGYYNTNIPGVGIKMGSFSSPAKMLLFGLGAMSDTTQRTIQFIKTGNINSGILSSGRFAIVKASDNATVAYTYNIIGANSTQVACSIRTPNLTFPIGNILASYFGSSVGTIPSGAQNTQYLSLDCDAGANINVSLQGTENPDVSTSSVLALTGQGNADVAKGVGVQLLYNGTPLVLNNRIMLKQSAGGQETFPITARYYQTKTSVSTGKANASATLDLTYQ